MFKKGVTIMWRKVSVMSIVVLFAVAFIQIGTVSAEKILLGFSHVAMNCRITWRWIKPPRILLPLEALRLSS